MQSQQQADSFSSLSPPSPQSRPFDGVLSGSVFPSPDVPGVSPRSAHPHPGVSMSGSIASGRRLRSADQRRRPTPHAIPINTNAAANGNVTHRAGIPVLSAELHTPRTPRERRYITSPLNDLLHAIPSDPIDTVIQVAPSADPPTSPPPMRIMVVDESKSRGQSFSQIGLARSRASSNTSGNEDHTGMLLPNAPIDSSAPLPVPDYDAALVDPNDPISVAVHQRNVRRQSVIKPGRSSIAFVPTEEDNRIPQSTMRQLPACCTGATNMTIPAYITGEMFSVVLPSRLAVLGRQDFKALSVFDLHHIGNSVLGYAPNIELGNLFTRGRRVLTKQLYFLPAIFTRSTAYMIPFLKMLVAFIIIILILAFFGIEFHIGYYWLIEYMFSYSWKSESENIRTLAKSLWNSNVGCWIDVVKLTPGDEIRPMLRTVVARVYRCVIFMCPEYVASPNCCIEMHEAIQRPEKLLFCILEPLETELMAFIETLVPLGAQVVHGIPALCQQLDAEVNDSHNLDYFKWWQTQDISGAGVPESVVPTHEWPIPRFSLRGRLFLPEKTISCGPVFLAGDCSDAGLSIAIPWLLVGVLTACAICFWNIIQAFIDGDNTTTIDYILLVCIFLVNLGPLALGGEDLIDTRRYIDASLRPLLASRAVGGGVLIEVVGAHDDFIVQILKKFLGLIGHLKPSHQELHDLWLREIAQNRLTDAGGAGSFDQAAAKKEHERRIQFREEHARMRNNERVIRIVVMDTLESRLKYFGSDDTAGKDASTIYIWSGAGDPFTKDKVGERLMRFLVLVAAWERQNLAASITTALSARVCDLVHKGGGKI